MNVQTVWIVVVGVAALAILLITNLFQPLDVKITYTAEQYFEVRKLFFAAGVLAVLGFILILSVAVYMTLSQANPAVTAGKDIFDSIVKVVPPIITLVLGYYFGQQSALKTSPAPISAESTQSGRDLNQGQQLGGKTKDASTVGGVTKDQKPPTPTTSSDVGATPQPDPASAAKKP